METTGKLRLLPIEWKNEGTQGELQGYIGVFKVGTITSTDEKHHVSVIKEGIILTKCEIDFSKQTRDSGLQQAKDYVSNKITDRIISSQNNTNNFLDS